ncbi:hypothetical protein AWE51_02230 [Aquimarina aggregata]|uniref:Outer membrane protein beta-barrel domain-containing protein n=1 Tax=Aquimarina aggregata TaxID=1642818 RepID=A0A163CCY8_9FLAO|nr:outer membrane beta-barrel protein [Aquimarina aggregata]KZS42280.1 hypothetical protein AWE51_02230 [Aquimarina aggregata]
MKKLILTAIAVLAFSAVQAQDETTEGFTKGDAFISGSFGFNSSSTGDDKTSSFSVSPRVGYFVSENITVGARISYQTISQENGAIDTDTNTITAGAFGRYYFTPASKFSIFGEFGIDYQSINFDNGTTDSTTDGFALTLRPGVSYFLNNNFALEAAWGALSYATANPDQGESSDNFSIGLNLDNINLGLVYKF